MNNIKTAMQHAEDLKEEGMECDCEERARDPEPLTGHHWKCDVHMAAISRRRAG